MSREQIGQAFLYYQSHTQVETAAAFGVSQSTICSAFHRVFGVDAVRDAEATWRMKRTRHRHSATSLSRSSSRTIAQVSRSQ